MTRLPTASPVAGFSGSDANEVAIGSTHCRRSLRARIRSSVAEVTPAIQGTVSATLPVSTPARAGLATAFRTQNTNARDDGGGFETAFPARALGRAGGRFTGEGEVR